MALQKIWLGSADTDFANHLNWQRVNLRSNAFSWTAGAGGMSEYYVRTAANANPNIVAKPDAVYINGVLADEGSLGTLGENEWAWGDGDMLGYDTIYVRLESGPDPDTMPQATVEMQAAASGADAVTLSSAAVRGITSNVDQSALSAAAWVIEPGFRDKQLGSQSQPLRITPSSLMIDGGGSAAWYLDIGAANIPVEVRNAPIAVAGLFGLYLTGSNMTTLTVRGGSVGVAVLPGDTSTVNTVITTNGQAVVTLGAGVSLTTARSIQGTITLRCGGTTFDCQGGQMNTEQAAVASGNVFVSGGTFVDKSTGTHAAVTINGGTLDTTQLTGAKTFTTLHSQCWQLQGEHRAADRHDAPGADVQRDGD